MLIIYDFLRCISCKEPLTFVPAQSLVCSCGLEYPTSGKNIFLGGKADYVAGDKTDSIKGLFKKFPKLYQFLIVAISPVYPLGFFRTKKFIKSFRDSDVLINLGSGNSNLSDQMLNLDFIPYPEVNFVADLTNLPFQDSSIDGIVNLAVLEHVPEPQNCVSEFHRVLKPGGRALVFIPFIQGFHASPYDFQRYTSSGMQYLFKDFVIVKIQNSGPTSGLVWVLAEWLSIFFSFGLKPLQRFFSIFFMVILSPLKWLDSFLRLFPGAENISTGFLIEVNKK